MLSSERSKQSEYTTASSSTKARSGAEQHEGAPVRQDVDKGVMKKPIEILERRAVT
jgi:hypothetical protein